MARNKEALLLLIDVSPSMHNLLTEVERVCSMLIEKKLIYSKSDEVGVILFGTDETNNDLTKEVGGYEHIVVLQQIKVVDEDTIETLQKLPRGTSPGDFLDAIVVGMDMLIKKFGPTNKGKKRLCLLTSAQYRIKEPYEGTKEDQIDMISAQMNANGMKLECIIVRGKLTGDANRRIMDENDLLLNRFSKKSCAKTIYVESPTSLLGAIRTRNISPVTIFRGDLELSPRMKIKVWVYKKTSEERFPRLKKYSDKAPPTDRFATHEVKVDYEYRRVDDPSKVVPPEQRIKGYRYGPQVIPISSAEWDAVKFKPERSVKLLGFTDSSNILRHYYMRDVNIFIAEPGNTRAILAVSALARAMQDMNKVAILRCVWRHGQGNVVVGVLTPNVSHRDNIPDSFYFNVLPFAEDIREFQFPSFKYLPSSCQPNAQQQKAADSLVKMLDLGSPGKEVLQPDLTPNPILERFYCFLELKSKQPDATVPLLDNTLKLITEPDPELLSQNKSFIDEFSKQFELMENIKIKKSSRRLWREKPSGSNEGEGAGDVSDAQAVESTKNESAVKVDKIGDLTPVQDFEAMMSRRDSTEWVNKAIKDMKNIIFDLVENSYEGDTYQKAVECLIAFRKGCILEQEPKQFNDFLRHLCKFCRKKDLSSFCEFLTSKQITLITKTEAVDSDATEEEARSFLVKSEPTFL
ncbi:PREDICTED: ATP-dependent DNA helicase 2 subunit KU80 [Nelumbo nucifera]|uniref:ATP-dependent DNA helicase 2 subunit KU80 n=1 Tax=Nelumbo nucifera TaxID=4432 RepID=A0A1U8BKI4_NELNU|nr:PREDICTED: ATP-dependent DNA helicase 2 subunit KU80 [Nelumbo nucifera]